MVSQSDSGRGLQGQASPSLAEGSRAIWVLSSLLTAQLQAFLNRQVHSPRQSVPCAVVRNLLSLLSTHINNSTADPAASSTSCRMLSHNHCCQRAPAWILLPLICCDYFTDFFDNTMHHQYHTKIFRCKWLARHVTLLYTQQQAGVLAVRVRCMCFLCCVDFYDIEMQSMYRPCQHALLAWQSSLHGQQVPAKWLCRDRHRCCHME